MQRVLSVVLLCTLLGVQCHPMWKKSDMKPNPQPTESVNVMFGLKQQNLKLLEEKFWSVSDPDSEEYANYLSMEDITEIISPTQEAIKTTMKWISSFNPSNINMVANRDYISARLSVAAVEEMLQVKLYNYVHTKNSNRKIIRSPTPYTIPSEMREHVEMVLGVSNFPMESKRGKAVEDRIVKPQLKENSNAPDIFVAFSRGGKKLEVKFFPICKNGQQTTTIPPCSDYPPIITSAIIYASSAVSTVSDNFTDTNPPNCQMQDGNTFCSVTTDMITYYHQMTVSLQMLYEDGLSDISTWPFPVVSTPPVIPQSIYSLYNIPDGYTITNPNITQAVVEFEQQYYSPTDLDLFFTEMGLPTDTPVTVVGPNDATNPGGEANLDIQYIMAVGRGAPTTFWSIYANSTVEIDDILKWAIAMSNTTNPPLVNSLSYGMSENNVDTYLGPGYLTRSDTEFQKLALRGITIIIADGDTGAGDLGALPMSNPTCDVLHPDWPSQSPYVTAVGTTYITPWAEEICYSQIDCDGLPLGEISTSMDAGLFWSTGGGFSNTQPRPDYQEDFVNAYLGKATLPPSYTFNSSGRAYPDAVAVGHNCMIALGGSFIPVDGTSASAPIFAGVISLLNDVRATAGYPPLGFINPLFYKIATIYTDAFYDVTVGYNRCGAFDWSPQCCDFGFQAAPGWDATSGLGTPNFEVLSNAVVNLIA